MSILSAMFGVFPTTNALTYQPSVQTNAKTATGKSLWNRLRCAVSDFFSRRAQKKTAAKQQIEKALQTDASKATKANPVLFIREEPISLDPETRDAAAKAATAQTATPTTSKLKNSRLREITPDVAERILPGDAQDVIARIKVYGSNFWNAADAYLKSNHAINLKNGNITTDQKVIIAKYLQALELYSTSELAEENIIFLNKANLIKKNCPFEMNENSKTPSKHDQILQEHELTNRGNLELWISQLVDCYEGLMITSNSGFSSDIYEINIEGRRRTAAKNAYDILSKDKTDLQSACKLHNAIMLVKNTDMTKNIGDTITRYNNKIGKDIDEFVSNYNSTDLTVKHYKKAQFSANELLDLGFTKAEILAGGYSETDFGQAPA